MLRLWFLRINAVYLDPRFAPLCLLLFIIQELYQTGVMVPSRKVHDQLRMKYDELIVPGQIRAAGTTPGIRLPDGRTAAAPVINPAVDADSKTESAEFFINPLT